MTTEQRADMIEFLKSYKDVFAWSYQDMPGLDTDLVVHRLPLIPGVKPVKQKLRRLRPEWNLKMKKEVMKQFQAGFLAVSTYPEWLANIVPVRMAKCECGGPVFDGEDPPPACPRVRRIGAWAYLIARRSCSGG